MKRILLISVILAAMLLSACGAPAVTEQPTQPKPATFTISNLSISPAEINTGERITISVLATNNGDLAGNYKVIFKINNVTVETVDVPLASGDIKKVDFAATIDYAAGTYSVNVNGLLGAFTVRAPVIKAPIPFQDNYYTIRVSIDKGLAKPFTGSYMVVTSGGQVTSKSVDGYLSADLPREYTVKGMIVSCVFQKLEEERYLLKVEILYNDVVIVEADTWAAYGVVSVATP